MGQIGFDVLGNDEALDVHYLYFEKYNAGKTTSEIEEWFKSNYSYNFENKVIEDNSNFWLGLAMAQWETKALSPMVKEMVTQIIEQDVEADIWEEEYPERKKYLIKFLKKLSKEKKTAKKPVKQRLFKAPFKKGDVITCPIDEEDGKVKTWGIMVCIANTEGLLKTATCLFAVTTYEKKEPATPDDIKNARINREPGDDSYSSELMKHSLTSYSRELGDFERLEKCKLIGEVEVEKSFNMKSYCGGGNWRNTLDSKYSDAVNISLEELIKKPDSPYTEWAELIVFLNSVSPNYDERAPYRAQFDTYYKFLRKIRKDKKEYKDKFIPFIENYLCIRDVEFNVERI